jgi:mannosyltransferase OCH1-like enzyme
MFYSKSVLGFFLALFLNFIQINAIPPVAHFCYGLWDDDAPSEFYNNTMKEWEKKGWSIRFWGREEVDELLGKYPSLESLSMSFTRKVQKADLARYLIVYEHGGFYFDLDCRPRGASLLDDLEEHSLDSSVFFVEYTMVPILAKQTRFFPIRKGIPEHVEHLANFAFGASEKSPVIWRIIELLEERCNLNPTYNGDYDIIYKTGPNCLTTSVHAESEYNSKRNMWIVDANKYFHHYGSASWKQNKDVKL